MSIPLRMNLVAVKIKKLVPASVVRDRHFDEPRAGENKVYGTVIPLNAQIVYDKVKERDAAMTGDPGTSKGHLCFRKDDLDLAAVPVVLKKGDIITEIAGVAVDYKITEVRPSGHLRGRANLLLTFFANNEDVVPTFKR